MFAFDDVCGYCRRELAGGIKRMSEVLERGDVYFLYRPATDIASPDGLYDVADLHLVFKPHDRRLYRLLTVGKKRLPDWQAEGERFWGYVAFVTDDAEALAERLGPRSYTTETLGERTRHAVRPAGAGAYALLRRSRHTELAYVLELPEESGEVQEALNIRPEGSVVLAVKNPRAASPPDVGLPEHSVAEFPAELQERFEGRRWLAVDPPSFLDHRGAELLLVGETADLDDREVELELQGALDDPEEVFKQLRLDRHTHPTAPLLEGQWA
ncbi:MAG: hypothetical protein M3N32_11200 [Actinomycetota bacterium]|nr:hypothetical protein [Actinomycetota bacterium]